MLLTVLTKALGFIREMVLSYVYGASSFADAYLISQTIPTVVFSFVSAGIATGFIPLYSRILSERGKLDADKYTSNLCNALSICAVGLIVFVLIFVQPVVQLFASGFSGETLLLATQLTRISIFGVCFTGLVNLFTAYLRLQGNYIVPALTGLPMNLVIIICLLISSAQTNIWLLAVGSVVAIASQLVVCIPFLCRAGFRYTLFLDLQDQHMKEMMLIALPVIAGTAVREINILVDRTLASMIAVGGISALNYAARLDGFVQGLFVLSVTTVLYPMISKRAAEGDMKGFKAYLVEAISMVNLLVIPTTVGAMIFSREIVTLLFGRGALL